MKCIVVSVVGGLRSVCFYVFASSDDCEIEKVDVAVGL